MRIREFQIHIWNIYKEHDSRRGVENTLKWFLSEVYEFTKAVEKGDLNSIREEAADVLAWLSSVLNLLGIDLEGAALDRYGRGCPKCNSIPCKCNYRDKPGKDVECITKNQL